MELETALRPKSQKTQTKDLILKQVPGKGRGVFAARGFAVGEFVLEFLGDIRDIDSFDDLTYALQVGPRDFMTASGGIDDFVNHSCDPNTGVREDEGHIVLFALKPIQKGEEITFDYATTQEGGYWTMRCCCESPACRRTIGDFSDLPEARRLYYISHNAVLPYLKDSSIPRYRVIQHETRRR